MIALDELIIDENSSIACALGQLDRTGRGILLVTGADDRFVGTLTDGDIRRLLLKSGQLDGRVSSAVNRNPVVVSPLRSLDASELARRLRLDAVPVVDSSGRIVDCVFADGESAPITKHGQVDLPVVMMAGGLGTRLYPFTKILPKPLIPVNDIPIAERIMDAFHEAGCSTFHVVVNHKKEMIKAYFREAELDYEVKFIDEEVFQGTGGGLKLVEGIVDETFILTNCDILVSLDLSDALKCHKESGNCVTMVVSLKNYQIPYGTVEMGKGGEIIAMREKPSVPFLVNTGCYIVEPELISLIGEKEVVDFPTLMQRGAERGMRMGAYPVSGDSWMDMGQLDELKEMSERLSS